MKNTWPKIGFNKLSEPQKVEAFITHSCRMCVSGNPLQKAHKTIRLLWARLSRFSRNTPYKSFKSYLCFCCTAAGFWISHPGQSASPSRSVSHRWLWVSKLTSVYRDAEELQSWHFLFFIWVKVHSEIYFLFTKLPPPKKFHLWIPHPLFLNFWLIN